MLGSGGLKYFYIYKFVQVEADRISCGAGAGELELQRKLAELDIPPTTIFISGICHIFHVGACRAYVKIFIYEPMVGI
jgi:hypothetical protein